MSDHEPGTYRKGESTREAKTAAEAVRLRWEGYTPVDAGETPRKVLQARAKELGIDARLANDKLEKLIDEPTAGSPEDKAGDVPESPLEAGGPAIVLGEESPLSDDGEPGDPLGDDA